MNHVDFHADIERLILDALRQFADWTAENWQITEAEARTLTEPSAAPAEYARGYNDAIMSIRDAFACWSDEGWPS